MPNPDCPQCGGNRTYKATDIPDDTSWRCKNCGAEFEPDDEGGDYYTDPTARVQREEEYARWRREKRRGG